MTNKQELRSKARSASAGEWIKESGEGCEAICSSNDQANGNFIISHFEGPDAKATREFVQAANPVNVQALVEALESAQRKIAELEARTITVTLPAHKYRECVNGLLEEAIAYAGTQQLRERLSSRLANFVQPDHTHTRCAAGIKCEVKGE